MISYWPKIGLCFFLFVFYFLRKHCRRFYLSMSINNNYKNIIHWTYLRCKWRKKPSISMSDCALYVDQWPIQRLMHFLLHQSEVLNLDPCLLTWPGFFLQMFKTSTGRMRQTRIVNVSCTMFEDFCFRSAWGFFNCCQ